jgi:hypothetical protein
MGIYGSNKRNKGRAKREFNVQLKSANEVKQVYSIDFSEGGMRVGGPMLQLSVGDQVELILEKSGNKASFLGQVARQDGIERIKRIGRDANAFFIRIVDEKFVEFVKANFSV